MMRRDGELALGPDMNRNPVLQRARRAANWAALLVLFGTRLLPAQQQSFPEGQGKDTFLRICSVCHGAQIVLGRGNTVDGWTQVVLNMVQRGAQGSEEEFGEIVQYLAKNFPPKPEGSVVTVNVNKASAEEIKTALNIPLSEGQAIVAHREKNGSFKTVEQVEKVPGVDSAKIESKKDRITF
jgi:competence protein ComEA